MEIDLLDFMLSPDNKKLGFVYVRYHNLSIQCELVYHARDKKVWVRMPERWMNKDTKVRYCEWVNTKKSDEFQKIIIKKIFDNHDLSLEKIQEIHKNNDKKRPPRKKS